MSEIVMSWEQFLYELSALGFSYHKPSRSWRRADDGAAASDEALRDLHATWPAFLTAALRLWREGKKTVGVETTWEGETLVARLRAVE